MKLIDLRDALNTIDVPVHHYIAHKQTDKYIVWAEEGQGSASYANNTMVSQTIEGSIEYFTKKEFDENFDVIQAKLNSLDIAWSLEDIEYDEKNECIRYEWSWEMCYG